MCMPCTMEHTQIQYTDKGNYNMQYMYTHCTCKQLYTQIYMCILIP